MTYGLTAQLGELDLLPNAANLLLAAGGVEIDLDRTILIQIMVFSLLVVVLKPLLFDPVLRVFALREQKTDGAKADARQLQVKAGELLKRYESELERVHQAAGEERDRLRAETTKLENEIFEGGRVAAAAILEAGRAKIREDVAAVKFQLGRESERIAQELAQQVLGRGAN